MKKHTLYVSGTHCPSCKILIEDILGEQDFVKNIKVNLKKETLEFETNSNKNIQTLSQILTEKIKPSGYSLSPEKKDHDLLWQAIPLGLILLLLFFFLQKAQLLNFGIGGEVTPVTSFLIGLIASVSSCLAIVGGLVLSLSAQISQDDKSDTKTFILFHFGRLAGFAILGGILGLIGKAVGINFTLSSILGIIASLVMLSLGLNLIGVFAKSNFTLPTGIFSFFKKIEHKALTPLIIGTATFFLPCGFTQSMQINALSSGSFTSGLLIMFFFALGTLPVLSLLSFGSASFAKSKHAPLFFKSSGVVVVGLGIFSLLSGLAGLGLITPLFSI